MNYSVLSLKQPWATLLVHGLKTIEIRRWKTAFRGDLLIHAARIPDTRPGVAERVPPHLAATARLEGGIIGVARLVDCLHYTRREPFLADRDAHLNDPDWFEPTGLYGFRFEKARPIPFVRLPGFVRIFEADLDLILPPETTLPPAPAPIPPPVLAIPQATSLPETDEDEAILLRFRKLARSLNKRSEEKG